MQPIRLNIGAGATQLPGYTNLDRKQGEEGFPLSGLADNSVDEIRASHILEHFPHQLTGAVIAEWVRVLKPGGLLKIAVPDFHTIASAYLQGVKMDWQAFLMGGQVDDDDIHGAAFDEESLRSFMVRCGLVGISSWQDNVADCSSSPVSLNLQGIKSGLLPGVGKVSAVMSVPRLGFMDNFFCSAALHRFGIKLSKVSDAFWGQCLERAIDEAIADGAEWILTVDYDTVYTAEHIEMLLSIASRYPEADAIAPFQSGRSWNNPLMTVKGADGQIMDRLPLSMFKPEVTRAYTAHFGFTLLKVSTLRQLPRPLFLGIPGEQGSWDEKHGKTDDDIYFWKQFDRLGKVLYLANRVAVGHLELMIRWPDQECMPVHQHPNEFNKSGVPDNIWR